MLKILLSCFICFLFSCKSPNNLKPTVDSTSGGKTGGGKSNAAKNNFLAKIKDVPYYKYNATYYLPPKDASKTYAIQEAFLQILESKDNAEIEKMLTYPHSPVLKNFSFLEAKSGASYNLTLDILSYFLKTGQIDFFKLILEKRKNFYINPNVFETLFDSTTINDTTKIELANLLLDHKAGTVKTSKDKWPRNLVPTAAEYNDIRQRFDDIYTANGINTTTGVVKHPLYTSLNLINKTAAKAKAMGLMDQPVLDINYHRFVNQQNALESLFRNDPAPGGPLKMWADDELFYKILDKGAYANESNIFNFLLEAFEFSIAEDKSIKLLEKYDWNPFLPRGKYISDFEVLIKRESNSALEKKIEEKFPQAANILKLQTNIATIFAIKFYTKIFTQDAHYDGGNQPILIYDLVNKAFEAFLKDTNDDEFFETNKNTLTTALKESLTILSNHTKSDEIQTAVNLEGFHILPTGWEGHATNVVLFNLPDHNLWIKGNKGDRLTGEKEITVYERKTDDLIAYEHLKKIISSRTSESGAHYYTNGIDADLSLNKIFALEANPQTSSNCTWESSAGLGFEVLAALLFLGEEKLKREKLTEESLKTALANVKELTDRFKSYIKFYVLDQYIKVFEAPDLLDSVCSPNQEMFKEILMLMKKEKEQNTLFYKSAYFKRILNRILESHLPIDSFMNPSHGLSKFTYEELFFNVDQKSYFDSVYKAYVNAPGSVEYAWNKCF